MKKVIIALMLAFVPASSVSAAIYAKYDGVDGSSAPTSTTPARTITNSDGGTSGGTEDINIGVGELQNTGVEPDEIDNSAAGSDDPQEGSTDYLLEIKGIDGESKNTAAGGVNVAAGDVNGDGLEGEGVEPDEIDFMGEQESNFAILLSSGGDDEAAQENRDQVAEILKQGLEEADRPVETLSLNYEEIKTTVKKAIKLFGLIPVEAIATVEIDADENVKVKFPWWAFLATGKDADNLGQQIFNTLSNVLKTKHDTIKNAIGNIR